MYTALHLHDTKGSLLDSILTIEQIVGFAKNNNMESIALTNHGKMHSYVSFHEKCLKNNIKPIHGCEIYLVDNLKDSKAKRYHLILLAKNKKGIMNLFEISKDKLSLLLFSIILRMDFIFFWMLIKLTSLEIFKLTSLSKQL